MDVISISSLGNFGRFGNQLFQYAFARAMAERFGAELQTPPWIGQTLFGISDPPIANALPALSLDEIPEHPNVDLHGYFQHARHLQFLSTEKVKAMYQFRPEWSDRFRRNGRPPHVAAHLRRGDYVTRFADLFCIVSQESYVRACRQFALDEYPIVWYSDDGNGEHDEYSFLSDFFGMMHADILLRANSTFSWWAGFLGTARVYSPLVETRTGPHDVEFVEGNWPKLTGRQDDMILPP